MLFYPVGSVGDHFLFAFNRLALLADEFDTYGDEADLSDYVKRFQAAHQTANALLRAHRAHLGK